MGAGNLAPTGNFVLFSVLLSVLLLSPDCPRCAFCPYCTTHNTNIHAPGGIRTRNPSKRSAEHPRLRPLGHWDRHTQHSQQTNIHAPGGIRTRNPSRRAAADPRLRPLGHWDRQNLSYKNANSSYKSHMSYVTMVRRSCLITR